MTIGSLFSGIGGLELGLEWAGLGPTIFQVEKEPFCREVLARHWPDAVRFDDVCTVGAHNLPAVDVLCGGFPCQDLSFAGKGAGLGGQRSGLWREYRRIIGELRPRVVVVENVAALLARGLGAVLGDLAALGYDAWWDCIPASAVGAPHQRDRLFVVAWRVADADGKGRGRTRRDAAAHDGGEPEDRARRGQCGGVAVGRSEVGGDVGDADLARLAQRQGKPRDDDAQRAAPQRTGDELAHAECHGRATLPDSTGLAERHGERHQPGRDERQPESGLCREQRGDVADQFEKFIQGKPCAWCNWPPMSHAHHQGPRGGSQKTSDLRRLPLCESDPSTGREGCHAEFHRRECLGSMTHEDTVFWMQDRILDLHDEFFGGEAA